MISLLEQASKSHGPRWQKSLNDLVGGLTPTWRHPKDTIAAVRYEKRLLTPFSARWGMRRHHKDPVPHASFEGMRNPFWKRHNRERRCVVPLASFYLGGPKRPFRVTDSEGDWLWCPAFWEEADNWGFSAHLGVCIALIEMPASQGVIEVDERMLCLLKWETAREWLRGGEMPWRPWQEERDILVSEVRPEGLPIPDDPGR